MIIQAIAQEGRAWARLGADAETRDALARVEEMVSPLPMPDQPEHHFRYDHAKAEAYIATTLSWSGDPAAEGIAREVLVRLERGMDGGPPRPRRAASARLDLSMALVAADKHDEAASTAMAAVESGLLVPSNFWRASEVADMIEDRGARSRSAPRGARRHLRWRTWARATLTPTYTERSAGKTTGTGRVHVISPPFAGRYRPSTSMSRPAPCSLPNGNQT